MSDFYIGMDESNNGKIPRIFVAVYSMDERDLTKSDSLLNKPRGKGKIKNILDGREFKYIIVDKREGLFLGNSINAVAFAELIFNSVQDIQVNTNDEISRIMIDGPFERPLERRLKRAVRYRMNSYCKTHYMNMPRISWRTQGDEKYPLVNIADRVANILKHHYDSFKSPKDARKYLDNLVTIRVEDYKEVIRP